MAKASFGFIGLDAKLALPSASLASFVSQSGQKHKAMSWSAKGSKALAILKVAELNGQWHELWFPPQPEEQAVA